MSIKNNLKRNIPQIGTWISIPSVINVDVITSTSLNFIIIDREHGPTSHETAQLMTIAAQSRNKSAIIRPRSLEESEILRCLDIGVDGIQVSNVSSVSEVKNIKEFIYYPNQGNRGFSPFNRSNKYSRKNNKNSFQKINNNVLLIINVEGIEGLKNIKSICKECPKDSVIFLGAYDISKSLGVPGEVESELVMEELKKAVKLIKSYKLIPGTIASSLTQMKTFLEWGVTYLPYLADTEMLFNAYQNILQDQ